MQLQERCRDCLQSFMLQLSPPPFITIQAFLRQEAAQHTLPFGYSQAGTFKPGPVPLLQLHSTPAAADPTSSLSSSVTVQPGPLSTLQVAVDLHLVMSKVLRERSRQQDSPSRVLDLEMEADRCLLNMLAMLALPHVPQALMRLGDVGAELKRPTVVAAVQVRGEWLFGASCLLVWAVA